MNTLLVLSLLGLPLLHAALRSRGQTLERFLFNSGRTPFVATLGSAISGNIGIGTFVALFLCASQSAVIGLALALCYMAGLLFCAALAPKIHRAARRSGQYGLIDFLIHQHGIRNRLAIWAPFAIVFGLRTLVQLMALALILELAFALPADLALLLAVIAVAAYTSLGGYQAATETDAFQSVILLAGIGYLAMILVGDGPQMPDRVEPWYSLGPFGPELLIGILILFPFLSVLSVDNWHRIATSDQPRNARHAYILAALACGFINPVIVWLGYLVFAPAGTSPATVMIGLRNIMPLGQGWIADAILIVAVMSSIDTFTTPLISAAIGKTSNLTIARLATLGFFAVLFVAGLMIGDILQSVVAAFNSVVVFLPTVLVH